MAASPSFDVNPVGPLFGGGRNQLKTIGTEGIKSGFQPVDFDNLPLILTFFGKRQG